MLSDNHYTLRNRNIPRKSGKIFYKCSSDERHKLTVNQAKNSGYMCTHCGAELKVRASKIAECKQLLRDLQPNKG